MPMMLSTFTGNASLPDCTATVNAFYRRSPQDRRDPLFVAQRDPKSGLALVNTQTVMAGLGNTNFGSWNTSAYSLPEGSVVEIFAKKKNPGGGFLQPMAWILIRMRETAALRSIRIPLPVSAKSNLTAGYYEGRFDIITEEIAEALGFGIDLRAPHFFDAHKQAALFEVSIQERELSPLDVARREVITTVSGQEVVIKKPRRTRNIRMRRPGEG